MRNNWLFFIDLDGGSTYNFPSDSFVFHDHVFPRITSFVNNSRNLFLPGSVALQEAFSRMSKFAGPFYLWLSSGSNRNLRRKITGNSQSLKNGMCKSSSQVRHIASARQNFGGFSFGSRANGESFLPVNFGEAMSFIIKRFFKEDDQLPLLSLAASLLPPFNNLSSNVIAAPPLENTTIQMHGHGCIDQIPCEVERQGCSGFAFPDINWTGHAIEPRTGIEFPIILDNVLPGENNYGFNSEVLVGTGSRTMTIVKIKSLKIYAFGFYIHPNSLCETLGSKYASMPLSELNKCHDFYQDLLREDIGMTLRLVVNYSGMKVNSVKDAFEKSLRARLVKTNPDTDFNCIATFGSYFTKDISLPAGTIIDFRRTADGRLITEIGGNQIGAVQSKELCRAFFDMYVGDFPVSEQTKEEIGRNVANMMKRC